MSASASSKLELFHSNEGMISGSASKLVRITSKGAKMKKLSHFQMKRFQFTLFGEMAISSRF